MKLTHKFNLEKPARKSGGDKYAEEIPTGEPTMMEFTYVNQAVSRTGGIPKPTLFITISDEAD